MPPFMMAEEAHRAACVKSIDAALQQELGENDTSRKAFLNFVQVKNCRMVLKIKNQWSAEEVPSHITSKLGMTFETLGAKWL